MTDVNLDVTNRDDIFPGLSVKIKTKEISFLNYSIFSTASTPKEFITIVSVNSIRVTSIFKTSSKTIISSIAGEDVFYFKRSNLSIQ